MYYAVVWQHSTLPHQYFYRTFLTTGTLGRLKYKLPDDGHRLKHVGAF